eukprot:360850_1
MDQTMPTVKQFVTNLKSMKASDFITELPGKLNTLESILNKVIQDTFRQFSDIEPLFDQDVEPDTIPKYVFDFIYVLLPDVIMWLLYKIDTFNLEIIFKINHFLRSLLIFYKRCIDLDVEIFAMLELIFGFRNHTLNDTHDKLSLYQKINNRFQDNDLQQFYTKNRMNKRIFSDDKINKYQLDYFSFCKYENNNCGKWLRINNIEFFIQIGGIERIWTRIAFPDVSLQPNDLVNIIRPCAMLRDILKTEYMKDIYVPTFISSLLSYLQNYKKLEGRLGMKMLKNMHFMMNEHYYLSEILQTKAVLMKEVCEQRQKLNMNATIKYLKYNNDKVLLISGFCRNINYNTYFEIIQLIFMYFHDCAATNWDISNAPHGVFINTNDDIICHQMLINPIIGDDNQQYYNVFGKHVISFGLKKEWKLKILQKDSLCSKIGIINMNYCTPQLKGTFCDPGNGGYGFRLKDGSLYSSETADNACEENGMDIDVGDCIIVTLDLEVQTFCNNKDDVGSLSFKLEKQRKAKTLKTIFKWKQKNKEYNKSKSKTVAQFDAIDVYQQYKLAIALARKESVQLISNKK